MNETEDLLKELIREIKVLKMQLMMDLSDVKNSLKNIDNKLGGTLNVREETTDN